MRPSRPPRGRAPHQSKAATRRTPTLARRRAARQKEFSARFYSSPVWSWLILCLSLVEFHLSIGLDHRPVRRRRIYASAENPVKKCAVGGRRQRELGVDRTHRPRHPGQRAGAVQEHAVLRKLVQSTSKSDAPWRNRERRREERSSDCVADPGGTVITIRLTADTT